MNVRFYTFSKRTNSTKQPVNGDQYTLLPCELKSPTSIIAPVLIIKNAPANISTAWNYCYISEFARYYFIKNWTWLNGVWQIDCVVDVLASYKTQIGNMTEYVLRSSSESNGQVIDLQYPTTAETRVNATDLHGTVGLPNFLTVYGMGYYILGVISNDPSSSLGAVTYYQMSAAQLAALKAYMMSDTFLTDQALDVQTIIDILPPELLKTLYDPFKYICSCLWMPFDIGDIPTSLKTDSAVAFGWWEPVDAGTQIRGYRINPNGYVKTYTARIPVYGHPQRFDRGVYLDHMPFVDRMLYYPPFGSIPINDDSIIGGDSIRIEINVDMILGESVLTVYHDRPTDDQGNYNYMGMLARVSAPLGVPIQLAQTTIDIGGTVNAAGYNLANNTIKTFEASMDKWHGGMIGRIAAASTETLLASWDNTVSALGDASSNPVGQLQTSGTNGSIAQYTVHPWFVQKWRIVADDDNAQKGRPLCQVKTLNTLSGFIMVDTPDISLSCMEPERQQIASFMTGGFFFE